jgi:lipoprotein-anchoring transpeptidase ErfK/SrfK
MTTHLRSKGKIGLVLLASVMVVTALVVVTNHALPVAPPSGSVGANTVTKDLPRGETIAHNSPTPQANASTLIATLTKSTAKYSTPGGPADGTVPATWYGQPSALPVLAQQNGFVEVELAQRPNGSTGWISSSAVTFTSTPFRIVIDLSTEHIDLYKQGSLVLSAPAGIGTDQDPTPVGSFFVAFFSKAPSPAWGPFIIVTSGHSNSISDWEESGDAVMAIHGPLGADSEIGTSGAKVSHGCVRLHVDDLLELRQVPVGTPILVSA